jgi:hypothetical protein
MPGRSGIYKVEFPSRLFGKEFCIFHPPIWFFFMGGSSDFITEFLHFYIRLLSSVLRPLASERASELYVAQHHSAEVFPKLMGHHQSPALGAHYFGNAQALGHYPILFYKKNSTLHFFL